MFWVYVCCVRSHEPGGISGPKPSRWSRGGAVSTKKARTSKYLLRIHTDTLCNTTQQHKRSLVKVRRDRYDLVRVQGEHVLRPRPRSDAPDSLQGQPQEAVREAREEDLRAEGGGGQAGERVRVRRIEACMCAHNLGVCVLRAVSRTRADIWTHAHRCIRMALTAKSMAPEIPSATHFLSILGGILRQHSNPLFRSHFENVLFNPVQSHSAVLSASTRRRIVGRTNL